MRGYRIELGKIFAAMLLILLTLSTSTYAWFSQNRLVSTNMVSTKTGTDTVELQISQTEDFSDQSSDAVSIKQVNTTNPESLIPISTADLKTFVYAVKHDANNNVTKVETAPENGYYYHGRIYIRAVAQGQSSTAKMAVYLDKDTTMGDLVQNVASTGQLTKATRLGLSFDTAASPVIFKLDDGTIGDKSVPDTKLDGVAIGANQVLNAEQKYVTDPAVGLEKYTVVWSENGVTLPEAPLLTMELNKVYTMDIYYYLEGCDPDCKEVSGIIETRTSDKKYGVNLYIALYGVLVTE